MLQKKPGTLLLQRWLTFKQATSFDVNEVCQQLFNCCNEELGNDLLRQNPDIIHSTEQPLLEAIKKLAITPVAITPLVFRDLSFLHFLSWMVNIWDHSKLDLGVSLLLVPILFNSRVQSERKWWISQMWFRKLPSSPAYVMKK